MPRFHGKQARWWAWLALLLSLAKMGLAGDVQTFSHIKIHRHRSPENRVLVDKVGALAFDDSNRKLTFEKPADDKFDETIKVEISYDSVTKVVFETTTHMRGGGFAQVISAVPTIGMAGPAIASQHVHDYWFLIEYKDGESTRQVLFEASKDASPKVIDIANRLFGSRVSLSDFPEKSESIDPDKLPDHKSKHLVKIDKTNRPTPEIKPDKATIVVVCPPLAARDSGKGNQFKLHANDRVVAVNKAGTYSFAYLDPGKYQLVSQSANANGFEIELEAGQTYYFLQNTFEGVFKWETALSRNSPELVNYLMSGTYYSDWSRKDSH
jgi:hypothetical protein